MSEPEKVKIGIAVGGGTGKELVDIFKDFLKLIAAKANKELSFYPEGNDIIFSGYKDIKQKEDPRVTSIDEANKLYELYEENFLKKGVKAVFRTSVNAEALYILRQNANAYKFIDFPTDVGNSMIVVRDQAEGFYANTSYEVSPDEDVITFHGQYTKDNFKSVIKHATQYANNYFGEDNYDTMLVYKYHLFGVLFDKWLKEVNDERKDKKKLKLYQPDTAFTELLSFLREKKGANLLVIASNEIGDLIYEPLMENTKAAADKLNLYSRSYFFGGQLLEYQTVHGSADDLEGKDKVLPYATFRILSSIAEKDLKIENCRSTMDKIIANIELKLLDKKEEEISTIEIVSMVRNALKTSNLI